MIKIYKTECAADIDYELVSKNNTWRAWLCVERDESERPYWGFVHKDFGRPMGTMYISTGFAKWLSHQLDKIALCYDEATGWHRPGGAD